MRKSSLTGKTPEIRGFSGRNYQAETVTIGVAITTVQTARPFGICDLVHGGREYPLSRSAPGRRSTLTALVD